MTGKRKKPNPRDVLRPKRLVTNAEKLREHFQHLVKTGDRFDAMAEACRRLLEMPNSGLYHWTDPDGTVRSAPRTGSVEAAAAVYLSATKALQAAMAAGDPEAIRDEALQLGELFADLVARFGAVKGTQLSVEELAASRVASIRKLTQTGPAEHNQNSKNLAKQNKCHALELAKESGEIVKAAQIKFIIRNWGRDDHPPKESTIYRYLKEK